MPRLVLQLAELPLERVPGDQRRQLHERVTHVELLAKPGAVQVNRRAWIQLPWSHGLPERSRCIPIPGKLQHLVS